MTKAYIELEDFLKIRAQLKQQNRKVVFTNGCFDILHAGHVDYLSKAKKCGNILVVGLNSDISVKKIKGEKRPIINEEERAFILSNIKAVDYVVLFNEPTPKELISKVIPDILVKGEDWSIENIVGKDIVEKNGGEVKTIKFITSQSTSNIIKKVLDIYNE